MAAGGLEIHSLKYISMSNMVFSKVPIKLEQFGPVWPAFPQIVELDPLESNMYSALA
jgi:hypothetical protein